MSTVVKTMFEVLYIVICIAIIVIVLMQEGKNSGLDGARCPVHDSFSRALQVYGVIIKK